MTHPRDQLDHRIERDQEALGAASRAALWPLERVRRIAATETQIRPRGETIMSKLSRWKSRPRLVSILGVCAVAAVLLVIPLRYQRTVGHRIDLTVSGEALDRVGIERLTGDVGLVTRARALQVSQAAGGGVALGIEMRATSEERAGRVAAALVERLRERDFTAEARVSPITETVSGNVYAMVRDRIIVIDVDTEGKTDQEVEDEIRAQLLDDGVADPEVKYDNDGDETVVRVQGERDGKSFNIVHKKLGDEHEAGVRMEIGWLDISREEGMTDEELEQKILRQLAERGLDGVVEIHGDDVRVKVRHHAPADE